MFMVKHTFLNERMCYALRVLRLHDMFYNYTLGVLKLRIVCFKMTHWVF